MNLGAATVTASRLGHSMHRLGRRGRLVPGLLALFGRYVGAPLVIGREHAPTGPFMICANHRSHVDSIALIHGLDLADRCALLAARDYFVDGGPWRRLLALPFTVIAVERITPGVSMLGTIREARDFFCAGGQTLISYPEGSRQTGESIGRFKRGSATLALALGLPVLPVFIDGTERVLAKGRRVPVPGPITLVLAPAIEPGLGMYGRSWRQRSQQLITEIETSVRKLAAGRAQQGGSRP
jgi:1-acyl-sn-glycerol-3-phosphate acyltransferase